MQKTYRRSAKLAHKARATTKQLKVFSESAQNHRYFTRRTTQISGFHQPYLYQINYATVQKKTPKLAKNSDKYTSFPQMQPFTPSSTYRRPAIPQNNKWQIPAKRLKPPENRQQQTSQPIRGLFSRISAILHKILKKSVTSGHRGASKLWQL